MCDGGSFCAASALNRTTAPCAPGFYCQSGSHLSAPTSDTCEKATAVGDFPDCYGDVCPGGTFCEEGSVLPEVCPGFSGAFVYV